MTDITVRRFTSTLCLNIGSPSRVSGFPVFCDAVASFSDLARWSADDATTISAIAVIGEIAAEQTY